MAEEKRELLEKLKFELAFVEDGGYGRSVFLSLIALLRRV
jgi:hypothetical protein